VVVAALLRSEPSPGEDAHRASVLRGVIKRLLRELVHELNSCEMDANLETMAPITVGWDGDEKYAFAADRPTLRPTAACTTSQTSLVPPIL
jgi:hypothetical protein